MAYEQYLKASRASYKKRYHLLATSVSYHAIKPDFPQCGGVVLALFAGSFYLTGVSSIAKLNTDAVANNGYSQLRDATAIISGDVLPTAFDAKLRQQPYISSVVASGANDKGNTLTVRIFPIHTHCVCRRQQAKRSGVTQF